MLFRSFLRKLRRTIGRYLTILAIIALGVGFFAGLRSTQGAMLATADRYVKELSLHDLRLVASLGFDEEDVALYRALPGVSDAQGAISADVIISEENGKETVLHAHTLTDGIDGYDLLSGRAVQAPNECLIDAQYAAALPLGARLVLSPGNDAATAALFTQEYYTVVGVINSVAYMNFERGTSSVGGGAPAGFVYLPLSGVDHTRYTEIRIKAQCDAAIYTQDYTDRINTLRESVLPLLEARNGQKRDALYEAAAKELAWMQELVDIAHQNGLDSPALREMAALLEEKYAEIDAALPVNRSFAFDRTSNLGYAALDGDTAIVLGVSKVFPLFFFLVAALVCITTMTRMVHEGRTENGVLRALGFGKAAITGQYLLYAGSASVLGCVIGFFAGSKWMPMALWQVYRIMYAIERPIAFLPDMPLFAICTGGYLLAMLGITALLCHGELRACSAELMRPKAPPAGKRVLPERIGFLWNRLGFMQKVSIRNLLRYKKRLLMMLLGIGGCTALLITGFGIRDSIRPLADRQFDRISTYDAAVGFAEPLTDEGREAFESACATVLRDATYLHNENATVLADTARVPINLVVFRSTLSGFVDLHEGETKIPEPSVGEVVINRRFATEHGVARGDTITLFDSADRPLLLTVSGVFDNYVYDYAYVLDATCLAQWDESPAVNSAFLHFAEGSDPYAAGAAIQNADGVAQVTISQALRTRVGNMLGNLDYIVLIVLVCAAALSFIVLYNLTNIAIIERERELATLKVLGLTSKEQNAYIFRENLILTAMSAVCGILPGILLLKFVMSQIKISTIWFSSEVTLLGILFSILLTFAFTILVDLLLGKKIRRIDMAGALKAVE